MALPPLGEDSLRLEHLERKDTKHLYHFIVKSEMIIMINFCIHSVAKFVLCTIRSSVTLPHALQTCVI